MLRACKKHSTLKKWNQFSLFISTFTKVMHIEKFQAGCIFMMKQQFKRENKGRTDSPICQCLQLNLHIQKVVRISTSPDMTTLFHARLYGKLTEIKNTYRSEKLRTLNPISWKQLYQQRQSINSSLYQQLESQSQHLKNYFFFKNRVIQPKLFNWSNRTSYVFQF